MKPLTDDPTKTSPWPSTHLSLITLGTFLFKIIGRVEVKTPPPTVFMVLNNSLSFPEPQFPHLRTRGNKSCYEVQNLNEMIHVK